MTVKKNNFKNGNRKKYNIFFDKDDWMKGSMFMIKYIDMNTMFQITY